MKGYHLNVNTTAYEGTVRAARSELPDSFVGSVEIHFGAKGQVKVFLKPAPLNAEELDRSDLGLVGSG